jgi:hypothetical protein
VSFEVDDTLKYVDLPKNYNKIDKNSKTISVGVIVSNQEN